MKYSVLLPTKNRLEYLKYAIISVIKQNYDDFEIIVSDNASEEPIEEYVRSLNEPRVKYSRTEKSLDVTESWNRSLDLSSGTYVIMLGDDDILLKNYFKIMDRLLESFNHPELVYTNSFLYAYPDVIPNFPKGVFQPFGALNAMPQRQEPFWLDLPLRLKIVRETLRFKSIYSTNMQHVLMRRSLVERVRREGKFFHSPYPDVYAMSALFLEAKQILIYPKEVVVIGVTRKSHGYYAYNNKQKEAVDFLNIKNAILSIPEIHHLVLPPLNSIQTFWLAAIELLKKYFPLERYGLQIDYKQYKIEQIKNVLQLLFTQSFKPEYKKLAEKFTLAEKISEIYPRILIKCTKKITPAFVKRVYLKIKQLKQPKHTIVLCTPSASSPKNPFANALEIFEKVKAK